MKVPLKYGEKLDWGNKPVSPAFSKSFGVMLFVVSLGFLRNVHARHAAVVWQGCMAALAAAFLILLVVHFGMKGDRGKMFWFLYLAIFLLIVVIALFV